MNCYLVTGAAGFITAIQLRNLAAQMLKCDYGEYLNNLANRYLTE